MLEKNNKISVLHKMVGLVEHAADPSYIVPQNSLMNISQKMGLSEPTTQQRQQQQQQQQYQLQQQAIENSTLNTQCKPMQTICPHCENMAKNFLCLESLIRTNYNANNPCNVCHSSLQYLQYVNKTIMEVFGNFDSVAVASQIFVQGRKAAPKKSPHSAPKVLSSQKLLNRKNISIKKFTTNSSKRNTKASTSTSTSTTKSKLRGSGVGLRGTGGKSLSSKVKNKKKSTTDKQQVTTHPSKKKHLTKILSKKPKVQK